MRTPCQINTLSPDTELTHVEHAEYLLWLLTLYQERRLLRDDLAAAEDDWERDQIWERLDEIQTHLEKDDD